MLACAARKGFANIYCRALRRAQRPATALVHKSVPGSVRGRWSYIDLFCSVLLEPRLVSASNCTLYCSNTCVTDLITAHPNLCGSYLTHAWPRPMAAAYTYGTIPHRLFLGYLCCISLAHCLSPQHASGPTGIIQLSACVSRHRVFSSLTDRAIRAARGIDRLVPAVMAEGCSC